MQTGNATPARSPDQTPTRAPPLVIDGHTDVPVNLEELDATSDVTLRTNLQRLAEGGVNALVMCIYVPMRPVRPSVQEALATAERKLQAILALASRFPRQVAIAHSADDVARIAAQGRVAIVVSLLNAYPLQRSLERIETWFLRGVRIFGLVHAGHNDFADSSRPLPGEPLELHRGLSAVGRAAIEMVNDLGGVVDVSQLTAPALRQALRLSRAPVVASHSSLKRIFNVPRNLSDEDALQIAQAGGLIQIVAYPSYIVRPPATFAAAAAELRAREGLAPAFDSWTDGVENLSAERQRRLTTAVNQLLPPASVADLADAVREAVDLVGIDHVGLASDFNDGGGVEGWRDASEAPNVTRELAARGFDAAAIAKLWGGNLLRVMAACERAARKGAAGRAP